jgi:hypothetical protein
MNPRDFLTIVTLIAFHHLRSTVAQPFTPGNLLVLSAPGGTSASTAFTLVEILSGAAGGATVTTRSPGSPCTVSGAAISDGKLTASADGTTVSWACYSVAAGTGAVTATTAASVPRAVQSMNASGILVPTAPRQISGAYSVNTVTYALRWLMRLGTTTPQEAQHRGWLM